MGTRGKVMSSPTKSIGFILLGRKHSEKCGSLETCLGYFHLRQTKKHTKTKGGELITYISFFKIIFLPFTPLLDSWQRHTGNGKEGYDACNKGPLLESNQLTNLYILVEISLWSSQLTFKGCIRPNYKTKQRQIFFHLHLVVSSHHSRSHFPWFWPNHVDLCCHPDAMGVNSVFVCGTAL